MIILIVLITAQTGCWIYKQLWDNGSGLINVSVQEKKNIYAFKNQTKNPSTLPHLKKVTPSLLCVVSISHKNS